MIDYKELKTVKLWEGLGAGDLKTLAKYFQRAKYKRGQVIFREGATGKTLYVILEGHIRIEHQDSTSGRRNTLSILGPGECFGEIALVSSVGRTASARTLDDAVTLEIREEDFLELIRLYPVIAKNIIGSMARKLHEADKLIESLIYRSLQARVAAKLLELAERFGKKSGAETVIGIALSQSELSELVGTNRETVTRILGQFRKEESVAVRRKEISILDVSKLKEWIN